jgi:uncharacterized secreted protein with C-terminal beta-propeller domain
MKKFVFALAIVAVLLTTFAPTLAMPVNAAQTAKVKRIPFKISGKITRFKEKSMVVYVLSSVKGAEDYVGRTVTVAISSQTIIIVKTDARKKYVPFKSLKTGDILEIKGNIREDGLFVATYVVIDKRTKK